MTDNEIIKALECCFANTDCTGCPGRWNPHGVDCLLSAGVQALDLIKRQKAEIERLEYTLLGVMHSVDKWLEGEELEQDEVNRAITMREKTLQIVEEKQAKIAELQSEIKILKDSNINLQELYQNQKEKVAKAKQKVIDIAKALQAARGNQRVCGEVESGIP